MKCCAIYYRRDVDDKEKFHPAHRRWIYSLKPTIITSFIPDFLDVSVFGKGMIGQLLSFLKGFFVPSADLYIMEGVACLPCTLLKKGKKIVINTDTFVKTLGSMKGLQKKYSLWLLNKVDGFVSTSEMMRDLSKKYCKKPNEVVYPMSHLEDFYKINPDLNSGNICCIGMSIFPKGTDILVDAYIEYKNKYPSAQLFICGEDNYRKEIEKIDGIVAPGRTNPKPYLEKSSVYMNCARHESFGLNILEAMAAGVVPIVSEYCGAKTFVQKIDKKLVVPLDKDKFVDVAIWLKKSNNLKKYSNKAKKIAKEFEKNNKLNNFKIAIRRLLKNM